MLLPCVPTIRSLFLMARSVIGTSGKFNQQALQSEGMNSLNFDDDDEGLSVSRDKQRLIFKQVRHRKKAK